MLLDNTEAAHHLQIILKKYDKKTINRIGSMYNDYCIGLKQLKTIRGYSQTQRIALHWRNEFIQKAESFPEEIRTYFINIVKKKYRDAIFR